MGQPRLNYMVILTCYTEQTDNIDIQQIYTEFDRRNELRMKVFAA